MHVCFSVSLCSYECVYVYVYVWICVRLCVWIWIYMCVTMCAYVLLCVNMSVWMSLNECVIPSFPSCMSVIFFPCLPLLLVPWRVVAAAGQTSLSFLEEKATSISYEAWPFVCVCEFFIEWRISLPIPSLWEFLLSWWGVFLHQVIHSCDLHT